MDQSNPQAFSLQNKRMNSSQPNLSFYSRNRFKIFGVLFSITLVFGIIVILLNIFLLSNNASSQLGGSLILTLIRIAFLIFSTPIAIILFFIGYRIDNTRNNVYPRFPLWIEIIGIALGLYFGLDAAILWILIVSVSQGILWTDPTLYIPLPIITPTITYLCFTGTQFVYSLIDRKFRVVSFKWPLIIFILSLPLLIYSAYSLLQIFQEQIRLSSITITNFKEIPQGNSYDVAGTITIPQSGEYHITATIGSSGQTQSTGILRLNGIENIDGLNNYELTAGMNKIVYYPSKGDCSHSNTSKVESAVTFKIRKVLSNQLVLGQPKVITETITCNK